MSPVPENDCVAAYYLGAKVSIGRYNPDRPIVIAACLPGQRASTGANTSLKPIAIRQLAVNPLRVLQGYLQPQRKHCCNVPELRAERCGEEIGHVHMMPF